MFCFWFYRERETYSLVHLTFHVKKTEKSRKLMCTMETYANPPKFHLFLNNYRLM